VLVAVVVALACLGGAAGAEAAVPSVFDGAVACTVEGDGVRFCGGTGTTVPAFGGGPPIDVNVALPAAPAGGPDGGYPMIMAFHGWGGSEYGLAAMRRWADRGYAVFTMSDRGWGESCGGPDAVLGNPDCADGYNRLMDTRFEVRDAQHFAGLLADEGLIDPQRIGATGAPTGAASRWRWPPCATAWPPGRTRTGRSSSSHG